MLLQCAHPQLALEQEFKGLNLPQGITQRGAPGVQAVAANEVAGAVGMRLQPWLYGCGQTGDRLVIFKDRHPYLACVRSHPGEGLQQFVVGEEQRVASGDPRQYGGADRVGVQHRANLGFPAV